MFNWVCLYLVLVGFWLRFQAAVFKICKVNEYCDGVIAGLLRYLVFLNDIEEVGNMV